MNYATHIVDGLKASVIQTVLVVDDAYDPPGLSDEHMGSLLEVLQQPALRKPRPGRVAPRAGSAIGD